MILFKREHVAPILEGRKTQTRRTGRRRWREGSIHNASTNYRRDSIFARLRIVGVREEPLGAITEADAQAEGYASISDYIEVFTRIYGFWDPNRLVWVVDFELAGEVKPDVQAAD